MRFRTRALAEPRAQDLHLVIRQHGGQAAKANQPDHAWNLSHAQPFAESKPDENVSGKERQLQTYAAVFPVPHGTVEWQEMFHVALDELACHALFMIRARVCRVPV